MAASLIIHATADQEYRLWINVAGHEVEAILDTGFTHPDCQIGLALDGDSYEMVRPRLERSQLVRFYSVGSAIPFVVESGLAPVSIVGVDGSEAVMRVLNAGENLLGVCYFHHLAGYELLWDLSSREITLRKR